MKLPSAAIVFPLALAMVSAAASTAPRGSNLYVKVHCPGVDFKEVSSEDGDTVGKVLMETFQASRNPDIDDSTLSALGFLGHELEDAPLHTRVQFHPAYFYGTFNCKKCYEDVDKTLHQGWERTFAHELATSSGVDAFENVQECKIQYGLTGSVAQVPANAQIKLKCQGIHVNGLTVAESTFVSHAVESTYNSIHRAIPGDESHLGDVFAESKDHRRSLQFPTSEREDYLSVSHHCYIWIGCHWLDWYGGSYAPTFCFHDDIWWVSILLRQLSQERAMSHMTFVFSFAGR